jgi:hypothetical protein
MKPGETPENKPPSEGKETPSETVNPDQAVLDEIANAPYPGMEREIWQKHSLPPLPEEKRSNDKS